MSQAPRTLARPLRVDPDHPALPGHFPGRPVVPGVVLLEAVLEAATELLGHDPDVAQLAQAKFLAPLLPGQDASIELALQGEGLDFRVLRAGAPLAQGRFVLRGEAGA